MQFLNVQETAERLRVSVSKVRHMFESKMLQGVNIGHERRKQWVICDEVLEAFMRGEKPSKQPQVETVKRGRRGRIDRDVPKVF
jgi:hypothetical protein